MKEKEDDIPPFPRMVDVELTNRCNFRCVMCPTGQRSVKRPSGDMDYTLFLRVLGELAEHGTPVRFIRWGEPMLYPFLRDAITEAKVCQLICHINTNGSMVSSSWAQYFVHSGLDSIKFSFQSVSQTGYSLVRNSDQFEDILAKIKYLYEYRNSLEEETPFIQIGTTVTDETQSSIEDFIHRVDKFSDAVYVGKTRDLQEPSKRDQFCECPEVFDKLSVNWDGSVSACCGDYDNYTIVGDLKFNTLSEIWRGKPIDKLRSALLEYRHHENHLCSRCARSLE
jgi:pyruvate-formate lyase-activating enzyme